MPKRIVPIKYTSREFDSIKESLVDYVKRYYPNTFKDFSEASFGSLMLDTVSYVGDVLSFYLDYQANECFLDTAVEYNNIIRLGKQFGYKFKANPSSTGTASFYILVPSDAAGIPDFNYMPTMKKNSQFQSSSGASFILDEDVDFAHKNNEVRAGKISANGTVTDWVIKAFGRVVSGMLSQETVVVDDYKKFLKLSLGAYDIAGVMSITDDDGHSYYEVEHLSQDVIYRAITNRDESTSGAAPAILKPFMVPRRFVVERERDITYLQFGGGSDIKFDSDNAIDPSVVDPSNIVLQQHGAPHISDASFDPYKLISSDEFGIAPSNTTLQITTRVNTADNVNSSVGALNIIRQANFEFKVGATNATKIEEVQNSVEIINEEPIVGDITLPNNKELKRRILDSFATQNRAVTIKDYEAMSYAMPPEFGALKRCKIVRDHDSMKRNLNIYVISEDDAGSLEISNSALKNNLKTWLTKNKMIGDTIDILDAKIINLEIHYEIIGRSDISKFETLETANAALRNHYSRLGEIGEPFWFSDVYKILKDVDGIIDVSNVKVGAKFGSAYSSVNFDVSQNISSDGRYIEIPRNCIVEIKYKDTDISGVIK